MQETAIVQAALDYFEGWFDGDATRMERALHPDLAKRLLAAVYREYLQLAQTRDGWKIVNAL